MKKLIFITRRNPKEVLAEIPPHENWWWKWSSITIVGEDTKISEIVEEITPYLETNELHEVEIYVEGIEGSLADAIKLTNTTWASR